MSSWRTYYEKEAVAEGYACLKQKQGSVLELMSLKFSLAEFTFYPKLMAYAAAETGVETGRTGLYAALIYLSSRIHFDIAAASHEVQAYRSGVQFPVLIGDYLYGQAVKLLNAEHPEFLDAYLQCLAEFHQQVTEYDAGESTEEAIIRARVVPLTRLSLELVGVKDRVFIEKCEGIAEGVFVNGEFPKGAADLCESLEKDREIAVASWDELQKNLLM